MPRRHRPVARLQLTRLEDRTTPALLLAIDGPTLRLTEAAAATDSVTVTRVPGGLKIDLGADTFAGGPAAGPGVIYAPGGGPTDSTSVVVTFAAGVEPNLDFDTGTGGDAVTVGAGDLDLGQVTVDGAGLSTVTLNTLSATSLSVTATSQVTVAGGQVVAVGGPVVIDAPSVHLGSAVTGDTVTIRADALTASAGGGIQAATTTIVPRTATPILLGGAPATGLWLGGTLLGAIDSPVLQIGDATYPGDIRVAGAVSLPAVDELRLTTTGAVNQAAGAVLTVGTLRVTAGVVTLGAGNVVSSVSGTVATGGFAFTAAGPLAVAGVTAAQTVTIETTAGALTVPAAATITATAGAISLNSGGNLTIATGATVRSDGPAGTIALSVDGAADVAGSALTAAGGATLSGGNGADTFLLSPSATTTIAVAGGAGTDTLTLGLGGGAVNDTGNSLAPTSAATVTYTGVERIELPDAGPVTVTGTSAANTLAVVRRDGATIEYVLDSGPTVGYGGPSLTFDALGGDDTLSLDFAAGSPLPGVGGLVFADGAGTDTLAVLGSAGNDILALALAPGGATFRVTAGTAPVTPAVPLTAEQVTFDGRGGTNCLAVADTTGGPIGFTPDAAVPLAGTVTAGGLTTAFTNTAGGDVSTPGTVTATLPATVGAVTVQEGTFTCDATTPAVRLTAGANVTALAVTGAAGLAVVPGNAATDLSVGPVSEAPAVASLTLGTPGTPARSVAFGGVVDVAGDITVTAAAVTFGGSLVETGGTQTYATATATVPGTTTLTAGPGGVTFTGAVDGTGLLTVTSAGPVRFDAAVNNLSVLTVNSPGVTTFAGLVSVGSLTTDAAGSTTVGGTVSVTTDLTFGDPVTLTADTTISAGGDATFSSSLSAAGFAVTASAAGVLTFGGPVTAASLAATGTAGVRLNGASVTTTGLQSYTGPVSLELGDVTLSAGGGVVTFSVTLDGPGGLTVNAAGVTFGGTVGATVPLAFLTADAPTAVNGGGVRTAGDQTWNGAVSLGADTTFDATSGAGGQVAFAQPLAAPGRAVVVTARAGVTFTGSVTAGSVAVTGGPIQVNGGAVTTTGDQSYSGPVTLGADATFSSTAAGDITFGGSVVATSRVLTVSTAGATTFGGPVRVNDLDVTSGVARIDGGAVDTGGGQSYSGPVILGADAALTAGGAVTFAGAVEGPGGLTVNAAGVTFGGTVGAGMPLADLTANSPATVSLGLVRTTGSQTWNGTVALAVGTTFLAGGDVTFAQPLLVPAVGVVVDAGGGATFGGAVTALSLDVTSGGTTTFSGPVTASTVTVSAALTQVNGGTVGTTSLQSYTGPVALGADAVFTAAGGGVLFTGSVSGPGRKLTVNTTGDTTFGGPVAVGELVTDASGVTRILGGSVVTDQGQVYGDAVVLGAADTTLTAGGGVSFASTLNGPTRLVAAAAVVTFNGLVGTGQRLASLTVTGPAAVNGGGVNTTGAQTWDGPVTVGADATFDAPGDAVEFRQAVTGAGRAVTVGAGGAVTFAGPVTTGPLAVAGGVTTFGAAVAASTVTVSAPLIQVNGGAVTTAGSQQFNGPVGFGPDTTFSAGGSIGFAGSVDGGQALVLAAGGDIAVGGALGGSAAPRAVTVTSAASATFGPLRAGSFTQQSGGGTTTFGGPTDIAGDLGVVTGGILLLNDVTAGGDVAFQTAGGGVAQTGGALGARNLSLAGTGTFDLSRPGNAVAGTFRAAISAGSVTLAVRDSLTIDPAAGVRTTGGDVTIRTGGDFSAVDPRPAGTRYTTPLIDLGGGTLTVLPGLARGAAVTLDAEVTAAAALLGVAGGGNDGADLFTVRPSAVTPIALAGNFPTRPLPAGTEGDRLAVRFTGATVIAFRFDGQDGSYGFADRRPLTFTGIETLPRFGVSAFVVQTAEPNDATGAVRQQYAVRLVRTQDGVPLGGGVDGAGLAQNPFVVSPARVSPGTPLAPPRLAFADVNGDGVADLILANGPGTAPLVSVVDGRWLDAAADGSLVRLDALPAGALLTQFFAYDPTFLGGVNVSAGDLDGDGRAEVMTAADNGGGPHLRTFTFTPAGAGLSAAQYPGFFGSFFAYEPAFRGGARVAVGDVTGDGTPDLVIGTGVGGGPRVLVYDGRTTELVRSFFAYDSGYRGGVYVDAGDYDQDGYADVLTAPGDGGSAHIRVFSGRLPGPGGQPVELASFLAFDTTADSDPLLGRFQSRLGVGGVGFGGFSPAGSRDILVSTPRGLPAQVLDFTGNRGNPTTSTDMLASPQFAVEGGGRPVVRPPASQLFYGATVGGFSIDDVIQA
ncbi:VCBS repeat-containing protein [bacterium]|nr:VCBS repeat-containing protein [bacterium]